MADFYLRLNAPCGSGDNEIPTCIYALVIANRE